MDFKREWTQFAVDAEIDTFGSKRIVSAHNDLRAMVKNVLWKLNRKEDSGNWAKIDINDAVIRELERTLGL